jgi:hypothetical protein
MNTRRWKLPAELENLSEDAYTSVKEWLGKTLVEAANSSAGRGRDTRCCC